MTELGLMTALTYLDLSGNDLAGTIPTELGNLVHLVRFTAKDCRLSGSILSELGSMISLMVLSLESNLLSGTAPTSLCILRNFSLTHFVTDCPTAGSNVGVDCKVPECCTFCRRFSFPKRRKPDKR